MTGMSSAGVPNECGAERRTLAQCPSLERSMIRAATGSKSTSASGNPESDSSTMNAKP